MMRCAKINGNTTRLDSGSLTLSNEPFQLSVLNTVELRLLVENFPWLASEFTTASMLVCETVPGAGPLSFSEPSNVLEIDPGKYCCITLFR